MVNSKDMSSFKMKEMAVDFYLGRQAPACKQSERLEYRKEAKRMNLESSIG